MAQSLAAREDIQCNRSLNVAQTKGGEVPANNLIGTFQTLKRIELGCFGSYCDRFPRVHILAEEPSEVFVGTGQVEAVAKGQIGGDFEQAVVV